MVILLATMPILVAIVALAVLRRSGLQAGLITLIAAILLALLAPFFNLPPVQLLIAVGTGVGASLVVLFILFPGLLLYQLLRATGGMSVLARGVANLSPDLNLQVLLLVLGLAPFVESVSGFGLGTVVVVPIIVALDIDAPRAALLGTLGQVAVPWGALAIGTALGAQLTGLDPNMLGANTALLTAPLPACCGLLALVIGGGWPALRRWWLPALLAGAILVGGEWLFSQVPGIELAGALASALVIAVLAIWGRVTRLEVPEQGKMHEGGLNQPVEDGHVEGNSRLWQALAPYAILTVLLLISRLIVPFRSWLQMHAVLAVPVINLRLPLLYTPGFWVLLATLMVIPLLGSGSAGLAKVTSQTWQQFLPGAVAIVCFLAAAQVMSNSGMMAALGAAAAALGSGYGWTAPWLGALGGWLTGSNTGGNAMFALLQQEASVRSGLPLNWVMAAQNGAGSIATMVAPARTILAATAAGLVKGEGFLLRKMGPFVLAAVVVIMLLLIWVISPH
ncbi:MAG: L-lactate permease [Ktedonobacteraceae bacterium]